MPEIDILDVSMGGKMLLLVCWNLMYFYASPLENNIYIVEKLLGNILILSKNAENLLQKVVTTLKNYQHFQKVGGCSFQMI